MDLDTAIRGRRSVRRFKSLPIERAVLERIIEAATWAPSGGNAQTWRFVIVTEPARIAKLKTVSPGLLGDPGAVVSVCQDLADARAKGSTLGETLLAPCDAAMAAQNLLLAAYAEGLGTCTVASFTHRAVARLLKLPADVEPVLLVSVGTPDETPKAPPRNREGIVHWEVYGG
ncbi:MAG: nitroreductase family protein [Candidatus Bipolaricaulis sp.]|nr:nitroreductase family protein [Candidatus Bipolaricaulis sp.]MDD5645888.1 nitroreductase family protein [Candidatus Bipolaricaulis sp.]